MKTLRIINQKHYVQEEIILSPDDINLAIKEFLESRIAKFQTGWNISIDYVVETQAVCSRWTGFTCSICKSMMTTLDCQNTDCYHPVCEKNENLKKCCVCVIA